MHVVPGGAASVQPAELLRPEALQNVISAAPLLHEQLQLPGQESGGGCMGVGSRLAGQGCCLDAISAAPLVQLQLPGRDEMGVWCFMDSGSGQLNPRSRSQGHPFWGYPFPCLF